LMKISVWEGRAWGITKDHKIYKDFLNSEPVNGNWGSFGPWSVCDMRCSRRRERSCDNPMPFGGGDYCTGSTHQVQTCSDGLCSLNGGWATWGSWGECESHCLKKRTRTCTNPVPNAGGEDCKGNAKETLPCHDNSCVESCNAGEDMITLEVTAEFFEQSVQSKFSYTKRVSSSSEFKKSLQSLEASASLKVGYGLFSAEASASYATVEESVKSGSESNENVEQKETVFKNDFLQILRKIETKLIINGYSAVVIEKELVDSVPIKESLTDEQLYLLAENYMKRTFPEKAFGNKFKETVCRKTKRCFPGWAVHGTSCYKVFETKLNWKDAENHCQEYGGHLASIHSKEENEFIAGLDSDKLWLGGSDKTTEGSWVWSDGSTFSFTNWGPGNPNNNVVINGKDYSQDCLTVNYGYGKWDDLECSGQNIHIGLNGVKFVCKIVN